jgi:hypothetical protein
MRTVTATAVAALLATLLPGARADEPSPYYIGASIAYSHDSNIFRTPTGYTPPGGEPLVPQADKITSAGVLAGIDQPFGRQHFYASGNMRDNRYADHTELNNTSYGLNTGLDWSTIERLSGSLAYTTNKNLATYGGTTQLGFQQKNVEHTQRFDASVRYGLVSLLSLEGKYRHSSLDYSASEFQASNFKQDGYSLGLIYRPSGIITLGGALRTTKGDYPDIDAGVRFRRNDADFTAVWEPTGESHFDARLSYTRQRYDQPGFTDFNGATGDLSWTYRPTGKLTFVTEVSHDTGAESNYTFNVPVSIPVIGPGGPLQFFNQEKGNTSHVNDTLQVRARWDMTAKLRAEAQGEYLRRSLQGVEQPNDTGHDNLRVASLQLTYDATRNIQLGCSISRESRRSTSFAALSYPYKDTTYGCTAQAVLQ